MFIYFEDWTVPIYIDSLNKKSLRNEGRLIKAFASPIDPRKFFNQPKIKVLEVSSKNLLSERFDYGNRGVYDGEEIEEELEKLTDVGKEIARSLFRFANWNEFQCCQAAMLEKKDGKWLIDHPIKVLDSIDTAIQESKRVGTMHLDIFFPEVLKNLQTIVNLDKNSTEILRGDFRDLAAFKLDLTTELIRFYRVSSERM